MPVSKRPTPFNRQEYLARLARCKAKMDSLGADVLLVCDGANITYLTGYNSESGYVAQGLLVDLAEEEPTLFLRRQDAPAGLHTCFMARERVIGYPESYIGHATLDGFDFIVDHMVAKRRDRARIGIEFGSVSGATLEKLRARLSNARILDASALVTWLRIVKSPLEIAVLREAATITDAAMARALEVIRPGVRECDAAAEITAQLVRGTPQFGGDRSSFPLMPCGTNTGTSHITWTEAPFAKGTHVNIEIGGCRHRYVSALMRTVSIGEPSAKLKSLHGAMVEGSEAALAAVRPGSTCGAVARAFGAVVEKAGFVKDSRCGYPIGINWLEPSASLRTDDPTVLEENMTFHLMLGMWIEEDFGAVLSETFRVTDRGGEVFGKTPRRLFTV
ncbi:MAG: Xaa-Pro peptidase family protein [Alphaproteobacteria bacterium]